MGLLQLLLLVAAVAAPCRSEDNFWLDEYRTRILDWHNEMRANETACHMKKMKYDMDLEEQAKAWVKKCVFQHENIPGRGENIGLTGYYRDPYSLISHLYGMWYAEKKRYKHGINKKCAFSCHYTQIIWANTDRLGCYFGLCGKHKQLGCFYTPGGNVDGEKPYPLNCTSPCPNGKAAKNRLCSVFIRVESSGEHVRMSSAQVAGSDYQRLGQRLKADKNLLHFLVALLVTDDRSPNGSASQQCGVKGCSALISYFGCPMSKFTAPQCNILN